MDALLGRVFEIVGRLATSGGRRGVNELARELRLPASGVHRVLRALARLQYVEQDPRSRTWSLTVRLFELGMAAGRSIDLRQLARPSIERLAARTGEEVALTVLDGLEIVYVDSVSGGNVIRVQQTLGQRLPAWSTAAGRCILAWRPDGEELLRISDRRAVTGHTITGLRALNLELQLVRRKGYATAVGERHPRVTALGAPVRDGSGAAVAALSVFGLSERLQPRLRQMARQLVATAEEISGRLGGRVAPARRRSRAPRQSPRPG